MLPRKLLSPARTIHRCRSPCRALCRQWRGSHHRWWQHVHHHPFLGGMPDGASHSSPCCPTQDQCQPSLLWRAIEGVVPGGRQRNTTRSSRVSKASIIAGVILMAPRTANSEILMKTRSLNRVAWRVRSPSFSDTAVTSYGAVERASPCQARILSPPGVADAAFRSRVRISGHTPWPRQTDHTTNFDGSVKSIIYGTG